MQLLVAENKDYKYFKELYHSAFPPEERPSYIFMKWKLKHGKGELLIAKDNDVPVGFAHLIHYKDLVYLFFLAVDEKVRGKGYGTKILQLIKERNPGKRIFLAREPLDDNADNAEQRKTRQNFYIRNGFEDISIKIIEKNYLFDTMSVGGNILPEEYEALIENWGGKLVCRILDMKAEEPLK